ncbi:MAG: ribosome maturation factor RimP [Aquisalimonadaceae bacterium]
MERISETLTSLVEPVVTAMGYELVGVEYHPGRRDGLLRIYIDTETGVTLDDCTRVSHQISGLLDVEDPIPGRYRLEISSPGLDRPLIKPADFERFAGAQVRVKLNDLWEGRRKIHGTLNGLQDGHVLIEEEGVVHAVPLDRIDKSNLVPDV